MSGKSYKKLLASLFAYGFVATAYTDCVEKTKITIDNVSVNNSGDFGQGTWTNPIENTCTSSSFRISGKVKTETDPVISLAGVKNPLTASSGDNSVVQAIFGFWSSNFGIFYQADINNEITGYNQVSLTRNNTDFYIDVTGQNIAIGLLSGDDDNYILTNYTVPGSFGVKFIDFGVYTGDATYSSLQLTCLNDCDIQSQGSDTSSLSVTSSSEHSEESDSISVESSSMDVESSSVSVESEYESVESEYEDYTYTITNTGRDGTLSPIDQSTSLDSTSDDSELESVTEITSTNDSAVSESETTTHGPSSVTTVTDWSVSSSESRSTIISTSEASIPTSMSTLIPMPTPTSAPTVNPTSSSSYTSTPAPTPPDISTNASTPVGRQTCYTKIGTVIVYNRTKYRVDVKLSTSTLDNGSTTVIVNKSTVLVSTPSPCITNIKDLL
ncbi:hypothetical protein AX774_g3870 [Zancudomyces culisetae]|uniref:Uncharacterized protein n=1 Tax=Zancudomyces culisetae TaxID=1213189 RepID=A0A1R1PP38_ZANCU|nr:hypothetical protein AX774_g3870 [Zancudomyces culisetae]|eukprot:OMH82642.1 hypothetical protein AX774_g3870 [Zancudomyces culisetae]